MRFLALALLLAACAPAPVAKAPALCGTRSHLVTCADHMPAAYASILPAAGATALLAAGVIPMRWDVSAAIDPANPDAATTVDLVDGAIATARSHDWWTFGVVVAFAILLLTRWVAARVSPMVSTWVHGALGTWIYGPGLAVLATVYLAGRAHPFSAGTFLSALIAAATTVLLTKTRDAAPSAAAQAAKS